MRQQRAAFSRPLLRCLAVAGALAASPAQAGDVTFNTPDTGNFALHVTSYAEIPFRTVLRQQYDYSCGSAALATLLRFSYARDVNEATVFKAMYAAGDKAKIQKLGFSLLDMKKYLEAKGYKADGYRLTPAELAKFNTPAIALIQLGAYRHFVVIKGVIGDHILVGDPAQGLRLYSSEDFTKLWNGIAFMMHGPDAEKIALFNSANEWSRWSDAHPLSAAVLAAPLAPFTRDLYVQYQIQPNQIIMNTVQ